MKVCITVDVEQDCPPFLSTVRGMEEGLPQLGELFREKGIPATFFTTGEMARRFTDGIRSLVDAGHELGCHGDTHRRFDSMTAEESRAEIQAASRTLREIGDVISFRAPNLAFPSAFIEQLVEAGYRLDSSQGKHKADYWTRAARQSRKRSRHRPRTDTSANVVGTTNSNLNGICPEEILRVPASTTSSVLRLPRRIREIFLGRLREPVVLFVHPWEFVDLRRERLRWDCRVRTGATALRCLSEVIDFYCRRSAEFVCMRDLCTASYA